MRLKLTKKPAGYFILGLLFVSILNVTLMVAFGGAEAGEDEDADSDGVEDLLEARNARSIEVENSSTAARINSKRTVAGFEDQFELDVILSSALEIRFAYQSDMKESDFEIIFQVKFENLTEYVDQDGDGVFDESGDQKIQDVTLDSFKSILYTIQSGAINEKLHILTISTTDDIFTLRIIALENFAGINGSLVTPGEVKLDVEIQNFPYLNTNSSIAVSISVVSSSAFESEAETYDERENFSINEAALATTMNNFTGFFSWNNTALIDGSVSAPVNRSMLTSQGGEQKRFYLCYPNGTVILHDPKIGVEGIIKFTDPTRPFWEEIWFIVIVIILIIVAATGIISKQEYREYLLSRVLHIDPRGHRLSMADVLENEKRSQIIDVILMDPGVHFNELLRQVNISAGNLAWHLDILETFKIIRKSRIGQYLVYFPYVDANPVSEIDTKLHKSKTTLDILQIIGDNPGMYQNQLAQRMGLTHKTIQYHLEKLVKAGLIYAGKSGKHTGYYPKGWPVISKNAKES